MSARRLALVVAVCLLAAPVDGPARGQVADPAERLLAEAQNKADLGDIEGAIVDWQAVISRFGDSESAVAARIAIGQAALERLDWGQAIESAQAVIDAEPRSAAASSAYVILGEARLGSHEADAQAAAETFARAWDLFPGGGREVPARASGRVREGEVRLLLGQVASAEKAFLDVIESRSIDAWTSRAYHGLARARIARGDWGAAIEALQEGMARAGRLADADPAVAGDLAAMRRLAAAGHRLYLRNDEALPWSKSSLVPGIEFKRPIAVAASSDGRAVIIDRGLDEALTIAADGDVERQPLSGAGRPFWLRDRWWVPVGAVLHTAGEAPQPVAGEVEYKTVLAGARAGLGAFLLTSRPDAVVRTSSSFTLRQTIGLPPRAEIADLDSDPLGRAVMIDRRAGTLLRAGADGVEELASGLDKPSAVAVGPLGYIYVLENGEVISVLDPEGRRVLTAGPQLPGGQTLKNAEDLAVDGSGRLWIADPGADAVILLE